MPELLSDALMVVVALTGIPLCAIALVAGTTSLLLACFQVQEASITHVVRIGVCGVLVVLLAQVAFGEVENLFVRALDALARSGET